MGAAKGAHFNARLQAAWGLHGEESFVFEPVEDGLTGEELAAAEARWIARLGACALGRGFNVRTVLAEGTGRTGPRGVHAHAYAARPQRERESLAADPMGRAICLLGDAPTLMIICTLLHGTQRFGELHAALEDVSAKTLSQRLKVLEELGFVQRQVFAEIPPRVEYRLTESSLALADIMTAIKQFGERYLAGETSTATPTAVPCTVGPGSRSAGWKATG